MSSLRGLNVMILATNGFEQSELEVPRDRLKQAGAKVDIVSMEKGEIKGWDKDDWGNAVKVDRTISEISEIEYEALVLPGGQINPDLLRVEKEAVDYVRKFVESGKPVAAICHAPWLLIEAGAVSGRRITGYKSIRTDLKNAGGHVVDEETVVDGNIITARHPGDLDKFCRTLIEIMEERDLQAAE